MPYPILTEQQWIKKQGKCCIPGCPHPPTHADDMDNVFCDECAEQDMEENPDNWPGEDD